MPTVETNTAPVPTESLRLSRKMFADWTTLLNSVTLCELDKKVSHVTGVHYRPLHSYAPHELVASALITLDCPEPLRPELVLAALMVVKTIIDASIESLMQETL